MDYQPTKIKIEGVALRTISVCGNGQAIRKTTPQKKRGAKGIKKPPRSPKMSVMQGRHTPNKKSGAPPCPPPPPPPTRLKIKSQSKKKSLRQGNLMPKLSKCFFDRAQLLVFGIDGDSSRYHPL